MGKKVILIGSTSTLTEAVVSKIKENAKCIKAVSGAFAVSFCNMSDSSVLCFGEVLPGETMHREFELSSEVQSDSCSELSGFRSYCVVLNSQDVGMVGISVYVDEPNNGLGYQDILLDGVDAVVEANVGPCSARLSEG